MLRYATADRKSSELSRDVELRREYTHNAEWSIAEPNCLSKNILILVKGILPQLITDQSDVIMALYTIARLQVATQNRFNAECVQKIGTGDEDSGNFRVLVADGESRGAVPQKRQMLEHCGALLPDLGMPQIGTGYRKSAA